MLKFEEFLAQAPKKLVASMFKNLEQGPQRIVKSSQAADKVYSHWTVLNAGNNRLKDFNPLEQAVIHRVYLSENRGLSEVELFHFFSDHPMDEIQKTLQNLQSELLIFTRNSELPRYFGFVEFAERFNSLFLNTLPTAKENGNFPVDYSHFNARHLAFFLSQVHLGHAKVTQDCQLHRKNAAELRKQFAYSGPVSTSVPHKELSFIFQIASNNHLVGVKNGHLALTEKAWSWMEYSLEDLERAICNWWSSRVLHLSDLFPNAFSIKDGIFRIAEFSNLMGIYSRKPFHPGRSQELSPGLTWEQLAEPLQELWLLGLAELYLDRGKIQGVKILKERWPRHGTQTPEDSPKSHSNFEFYLGPVTPPKFSFLAGIFSKKRNDDPLTLFGFSKDTVLDGLKGGAPADSLRELCRWLQLGNNAGRTIEEWIDSYDVCEFSDLTVLRVKKGEVHKILEAVPDINKRVRETIAGFGFIIDPTEKGPLEKTLNQLNIYPRGQAPVGDGSPLDEFAFPETSESEGDIQYGYLQKPTGVPGRSSLKYGRSSKPPPLSEKIRTIEYALLTEKLIEVSFVGVERSRMMIRPLHLNKMDTPVILIGVEMGSGHRKEFDVQSFTSLRPME